MLMIEISRPYFQPIFQSLSNCYRQFLICSELNFMYRLISYKTGRNWRKWSYFFAVLYVSDFSRGTKTGRSHKAGRGATGHSHVSKLTIVLTSEQLRNCRWLRENIMLHILEKSKISFKPKYRPPFLLPPGFFFFFRLRSTTGGNGIARPGKLGSVTLFLEDRTDLSSLKTCIWILPLHLQLNDVYVSTFVRDDPTWLKFFVSKLAVCVRSCVSQVDNCHFKSTARAINVNPCQRSFSWYRRLSLMLVAMPMVVIVVTIPLPVSLMIRRTALVAVQAFAAAAAAAAPSRGTSLRRSFLRGITPFPFFIVNVVPAWISVIIINIIWVLAVKVTLFGGPNVSNYLFLWSQWCWGPAMVFKVAKPWPFVSRLFFFFINTLLLCWFEYNMASFVTLFTVAAAC